MIYYIADAHFGHENILSLCRRPFRSVEDMNEAMIDNWNARVTGGDRVYILGDLFYRCADPEGILRRLKGCKYLIVGNHDSSWMGQVNLERYFADVRDMAVINDGHRVLTLCHYPLLTWKRQKKTWMIYGHLHANIDDDFFPLIAKRERMLNAGADINGLAPVTFEELVANNADLRQRFLLTGAGNHNSAASHATGMGSL